jgi:hypothetical protein
MPVSQETLVLCVEGAPCSGKSTVIEYAQQGHYEQPVLFVPEMASLVDAELRAQGSSLGKLALGDRQGYLAAQQQIVTGYTAAINAAREQLAGQGGIIVTDRGPLGVKAYVSEPEWQHILQSLQTSEKDLQSYSDVVLFLPTLALTDPSAYRRLRDTNPARSETLGEALKLHVKSFWAWAAHPRLIDLEDLHELEQKKQAVAFWLGRRVVAS